MNLFPFAAAIPALTEHPTAPGGKTVVRFFDGLAPKNTPAPYATWQIVSVTPKNMLAGAPEFDRTLTQIDVWANDATTARTVARDLRTALAAAGYVTSYREQPSSDPDTALYRTSFDFNTID